MEQHKQDPWELADRADSIWTWVERLVGLLGSALVSAAAPIGNAIGGAEALYYVIPISVVGGLLIWVWLWSLMKRKARRDDIKAATLARTARQNIRREYVDEVVNLANIAEPDGVVRDVRFIRCIVIGPVVIVGGGGRLTIEEPYYVARISPDSLFIVHEEGGPQLEGAIACSNVTFAQCRFHMVTFAMPAADVAKCKATAAER